MKFYSLSLLTVSVDSQPTQGIIKFNFKFYLQVQILENIIN